MNEFELFQSALDLEDPADRKSFLTSACHHEPALLSRVEALLASHHVQSQFLNTPVVQQITDVVEGEAASTMLLGDASTEDEEPDVTVAHIPGSAPMTTPSDDPDDEIPLGYLEPSSNPDSLGRLGHYEVLQVVGRGAFGTVLRAFDEMLHRVVAIKLMSPEMASTSPARKRFLREARASAAIRHEHVVSIHAVEEKPLPYLVMEYIPGQTLQQRLEERGPLDVPTVLRLGRQIAEGLNAAHAINLIHRDIKPGNILLETSVHDRVKITDFGLARAADDASLTQSGTIAGTPMYMAPEQALGHTLDQRADLFSFGSVLYQMLSGRPPFRAPSALAVLKRVAEESPRPIQEIIPEAPQWLCDIITKLHAKNPDERYQTAREIAVVLANCEEQFKTHAGLKDFSLIPSAKVQPAGWWKWVAVALIVIPLLAFGLYAFNRPVAQSNVAANGTTTGPLTDNPPTPDSVASLASPISIAKQEILPPIYKNTIGMEFLIVPKGKSWLGGGQDKPGDQEVEIAADFYLGKYEVTQEEWEKVMSENPSHFSRNGESKDLVKDISDADLKRFPVGNVSWDDCQLFVDKLNQREKETGWVYRLPKAAEWEYACRGGPLLDRADSAFDFYFAKPTNTLLPEQANFEKDHGLIQPCKVGSYEANRLGLFDLHGNVWEWCDDLFDPNDQPTGRVVRGGSYLDAGPYYWAEHLGGLEQVSHGSNHGFRLARVPSGAPAPVVTPPPLVADVLKDAVLLMNFEKETFYEKDGQTYVRDLSGNGNDGLCANVEFTPDGKAGGGLACQGGHLRLTKSLIHRQPDYSITMWVRAEQMGANLDKDLYRTALSIHHEHLVFQIVHPPEGNVHVFAWNRSKQPEPWLNTQSPPNVPFGKWYFLAVTLSGGGAEKGELRVTVNGRVTRLSSQMVDNELDDMIDMLGRNMTGSVLDEVAIFQRALTNPEIAAVRALGLKGTPLKVGKAQPVVAPN